jgi:hypothetical protein
VDPLGLGRDLFRLIGFLYWGLALVLVCVALIKLRRPIFKIVGVAVVAGVFASPLLLHSNDVRRINAAFTDSCDQVRSSIQPVASDSKQFVDYELVWLGLKYVPYESESIRYMLERKLAVLELTYDPQFWRGLQTRDMEVPDPLPGISRSPNPWGVQTGVYVRLSLQDSGHDTCKGFQRWSNEYPSQKWPWMQKLGMRPDQCIGFELVNQLQSRHGIYVERSIVERNGNNGALETHKYRLHDHHTRTDLGTAALTVSSVYGHRDVLCGAEAIAKQISVAISSTPDPRYSTVDEVVLEKKPFPSAKDLTLDELRALELNFKDRSISFDRKVWADSRYERKVGADQSVTVSLVGYELVSSWNDRIYRIPLSSDHVPRNQGPAAVGASAGGVAALIRSGYKPSDNGVLLEFSRAGEPIREQFISSDQMQALGLR